MCFKLIMQVKMQVNLKQDVSKRQGQLEAIRKIQQVRGLASLPEELRELAELRLENPEFSLRELGESLTPPITRSGVNHRMKRLCLLYTSRCV